MVVNTCVTLSVACADTVRDEWDLFVATSIVVIHVCR